MDPVYGSTINQAAGAMTHNTILSALEGCLREMRDAAPLLDHFPDDYGEAIRAAEKAIPIARAVDDVVKYAELLVERYHTRRDAFDVMDRTESMLDLNEKLKTYRALVSK